VERGANPDRIRVLVADDHPIVREGIVALVSRQPAMAVVAEASDGRQAIDLYRRERPDVALFDLRMPITDGVAATIAVRSEFPDARIVILTTYDNDEDIYSALRAGAQAYLLKDAPREELLTAIRKVVAGRRHIPPHVAARLAERVGVTDLTPRELEVLRQIVRGKSNKEIGDTLIITEGTVKGHVNNILSKLGVTDRTQAALAAVRRGLVSLDEAQP
jgi:two-component system NarL family response regulator